MVHNPPKFSWSVLQNVWHFFLLAKEKVLVSQEAVLQFSKKTREGGVFDIYTRKYNFSRITSTETNKAFKKKLLGNLLACNQATDALS